jgi:transcriptional regulator with XRE-family HTH domain
MTTSRTAEPVLTEIKVWMARRRINQSELAAQLGVQQSWVSKRLSGKVALTVNDLGLISEALSVPVGEFFRPAPVKADAYRDSVQNRYTASRMGIPARVRVKEAA